MAMQKDRIRKMVAGDMLRWNCIPAIVFDFNPRFITYRLESYFNPGELPGRKSLLTPCKSQPHWRLPCGNAADFENRTIRQNLDQTPARPGLELKLSWRFARKAKQAVGMPPGAD